MTPVLETQLSIETIHFEPGCAPQTFAIAVTNFGDRFASFQVELVAPGVEAGNDHFWYRLSPELSAKIPPGDQVQFDVTIFAVPPIPGGFTGTMSVAVRVFSLELQTERRHTLNLVIEGKGAAPPQLTLLTPELEGKPGDILEIPILIRNLNRTVGSVRVQVQGLPNDWLPDGAERQLQVAPEAENHALFICQLPAAKYTRCQQYAFQVRAMQTLAGASQVDGLLQVRPAGALRFEAQPETQRFPLPRQKRQVVPEAATADIEHSNGQASPNQASAETSNGSANGTTPQTLDTAESQEGDIGVPTNGTDGASNSADGEAPESNAKQRAGLTYAIQVENQSNLDQIVTLAATPNRPQAWQRWSWLRTVDQPTIEPEQISLEPGQTGKLAVRVPVMRPWWGWQRRHQFEVEPQLSDDRIGIEPTTQLLRLRLLPRLPLWLQIVVLAVLIGLIYLPYRLNLRHRGAVYSLEFDGLGNELVSASGDRTVRRWQVNGRQLRFVGKVFEADKGIRVVRYSPVNNEAVAAGMSNGEIQLWDLRSGQQRADLQNPQDDRVFGLEFAPDGRYLYSGHGSGRVVQWDLAPLQAASTTLRLRPAQDISVDVAVQDIALLGPAQNLLAIAGRFNTLGIWDPERAALVQIPYPPGTPNDYISKLASAPQAPWFLATADNQGRLMVWDVRSCLEGSVSDRSDCDPVDEWTLDGDSAPVGALAISEDGCSVVSGSDDGQIYLWLLNENRKVIDSERLGNTNQPINTVTIIQLRNRFLIAAGDASSRIHMYSRSNADLDCP